MKKTLPFSVLLFATLLFSLSLLVDSAQAIPAFARQYKISCTTCHAPIPKLKPYGDEFAGHGFILKENIKKRDFVTGGEEEELFLNKVFPIAARFDAYGVIDDSKKVKNDLQTPWGLKLLSGGALYKNIGYYFYFYLSERGEVAGIEDAYLHFDNLFGKELDLMVGQFQTSDPILKRELRLTFEDYRILKVKPGNSGVNLTYDRGLVLTYSLEKTATDFVGMIVNGNGKGAANEESKMFDNNSFKNLVFRVSQGLGEKLSIGAFAYYGEEKDVYKNKLKYYGPDIVFNLGTLEFTGVYLRREDSNPSFAAKSKTTYTDGIVAELHFAPQKDRSKMFFTLLYNKVMSDIKAIEYETLTLNASHWFKRNLRFLVEYTRDIQNSKNRLVLGLVSAF